jgi:hypothetical protein
MEGIVPQTAGSAVPSSGPALQLALLLRTVGAIVLVLYLASLLPMLVGWRCRS